MADVNIVIDVIQGSNGNHYAADVNNDSKITIADINLLIDIILGETEAPAVVPVYGDDGPTEGRVINVTDGML